MIPPDGDCKDFRGTLRRKAETEREIELDQREVKVKGMATGPRGSFLARIENRGE
jgi:hypothetical protein